MKRDFMVCKNKTDRDDEYVAAYIKTYSQNKAADICGVSRETIARAVRRAGIKLNGRSKNGGNGGGGSKPKITDKEFIEEAKTMSRQEIADKHSINICQIDRKIKRLGVKCKPGRTTSGGKWRYRGRTVASGAAYDREVTLKAVYDRFGGICQICGKPTDWNDSSWGPSYGAMYPTVDHIKPLSKGGAHTWDNVQLVHAICNSYKRDLITE